MYSDRRVVSGQVYSYTLRSYDPAGGLYQASDEVGGEVGTTPIRATAWTYLPVVFRTQHCQSTQIGNHYMEVKNGVSAAD